MNLDVIIERAEDIRAAYGGRDIFETTENTGAKVWFRPLGSLKGFYICEQGTPYIIINDTLNEMTSRIVCAHELGHDILHRELAEGGIRDGTLFLSNNKTEREANLFAAELLLTDKAVLSELDYNNDPDAVAYDLNVPVELLEYKLELLVHKGYKLNFSAVKNDFLK
ncbi:MAG: ImmA/IrrE family metallo-endopeptidase [Oscillospiraceae bacterium]|nr:ImmA/IrrE family metallo-endopeptidase [Oscillospiraceae bacterium]